MDSGSFVVDGWHLELSNSPYSIELSYAEISMQIVTSKGENILQKFLPPALMAGFKCFKECAFVYNGLPQAGKGTKESR